MIVLLTPRQVELVQASLQLSMPHGGGSELYELYNHISATTGLTARDCDMGYMGANVIRELKDCQGDGPCPVCGKPYTDEKADAVCSSMKEE